MRVEELLLVLANAKQVLADFEQKNGSVISLHETLKNTVKRADEAVRVAAMQNFLDTGEIKPHDAVSIVITTHELYNSHENKRIAARAHPEVLEVDTDYIAAHASEVMPVLFKEFPGVIKVNDRKAAVVQKRVETFTPTIEKEPVVHVKKALGEYLFKPKGDEELL